MLLIPRSEVWLMPRISNEASLEEVIRSATAPVVIRASNLIARAVADMVAVKLEIELRKTAPSGRRRTGLSRSRPEMTKWVADRRARRVPTFVIEMTGGLKTKKQIVAKYGENVSFEKGKPLPRTIEKRPHEAAREVKAKPPTIRKRGKAAA
jgi:hypothetical protein